MNFIAHYFFEGLPQDAHKTMGVVMPDLVRIFLRDKHIFPSKIDASLLNENGQKINEGAKIHMEQDKVFHNAKYFHHMMEYSKESFRIHGVSEAIPKSWFLAHIALELILDRYLMKKHPNIVGEFYDKLDQVDWSDIKRFLEVHNITRIDAFEKKLEDFLAVRYLFEYTRDERLAFALSKVYQRAGMEANWSEEQKSKLISCFQYIEEETGRKIEVLEKELSL